MQKSITTNMLVVINSVESPNRQKRPKIKIKIKITAYINIKAVK